MNLLTQAIREQLHANDLEVQESGKCSDEIVVKYFDPTGAATWHVVSGTPVDAEGEPCEIDDAHDWHLFGFCNLGDDQCAELGYLMLSDLESHEGPLGLGIERDLSYTGSLKKVQADCRLRAGK